MTEHTKTGAAWEPSYASILALQGSLRHSRHWYCPNDEAAARAIIAAVSADPLLSAAAEMREALQRLSNLTPAVANAKDARDLHLTVKAIADTALAKSRGEN